MSAPVPPRPVAVVAALAAAVASGVPIGPAVAPGGAWLPRASAQSRSVAGADGGAAPGEDAESGSEGETGDGEATVPIGVVAARDPGLLAVALAAAREVGGARFRGERLGLEGRPGTPREAAAARRRAISARAAEVRRRYFEADFLGCLATLGRPDAQVERALDLGEREAAAALAVFGAGCALGAGDEASARDRLRFLVTAELDPAPLARVAPELQALAEEVTAAGMARARRPVAIDSDPDRARVIVDGRPAGCETPCRRDLLVGPHRLRLERLGRVPRRSSLDVPPPPPGGGDGAPVALVLALDPAPAALVRDQLDDRVADGARLDGPALAQAASEAFGARVAVFVWREDGRVFAAIYDRGLGRVVARTSDASAPVAVRAAVSEWRGVVTPRPLVAEPWFWGSVVGAAVAVGLTVFFVTRPERERFDVVLP
ncbi:MAG TPA: PEGA domain-containing protein [Polyangiaceae bacterium LLY-WYZ-14_1]|nr:PEGA domain-containing protein [Polyangiaceae bacterium LLY-WYZ-14_1]